MLQNRNTNDAAAMQNRILMFFRGKSTPLFNPLIEFNRKAVSKPNKAIPPNSLKIAMLPWKTSRPSIHTAGYGLP